MKFGIVGLGLMGGNLARAAPERAGVVGLDVDESLGGKHVDDGLEAVPSLELLGASGRSSVVRWR